MLFTQPKSHLWDISAAALRRELLILPVSSTPSHATAIFEATQSVLVVPSMRHCDEQLVALEVAIVEPQQTHD